MRLEQLTLKNYGPYEEANIDLSRPVTIITGANASGKSTIVDAIRWLTTKRARCTDGKGAGAQDLIRNGAREAKAGLAFNAPDGGRHVLVRTRDASAGSVALSCPDGLTHAGNVAEGLLPRVLGASPDMVDAVLDAPRIFSMTKEKRSELLTAVTRARYTVGDVETEARAAGHSDGAIESVLDALRSSSMGMETFGPEMFKAVYDRAYAGRKVAKATLADLEAKLKGFTLVVLPKEGEIETAREKATQLEEAASSIRETIGSLKAKVEERRKLEAERVSVKAKLAAPAPPTQQRLVPPVDDLDARVADLTRTVETLTASHDETRASLQAMNTAWQALENQIVGIEQGTVGCPSIHSPAACPISEARLAEDRKRLPAMKKALGADKTAAAKKREVLHDLEQQLAAARQELQAVETRLASAQQLAAKNAGVSEAERDGLTERLAILDANIADLGEPATELQQIEQKLFVVNRDLSEARTRVEQLVSATAALEGKNKLEETVEAKRDEVAVYEEIVLMLRPTDGLPARLLQLRIGPVQRQINVALASLTGGLYEVRILAEDGLSIEVLKGSDPASGGSGPLPWRPITTISESEELRVGIALAVAFARMSGLGFVAVDRVDMLDPQNRQLLTSAIEGFGLEHLILIMRADAPPMVSNDYVAVYQCGDGQIQEVLEMAEATA